MSNERRPSVPDFDIDPEEMTPVGGLSRRVDAVAHAAALARADAQAALRRLELIEGELRRELVQTRDALTALQAQLATLVAVAKASTAVIAALGVVVPGLVWLTQHIK